MFGLRCLTCKATCEHGSKSKICVSCGGLMVEIPLTDGSFEQAGEEGGPEKQPAKTKEQTARPEGAGRVF